MKNLYKTIVYGLTKQANEMDLLVSISIMAMIIAPFTGLLVFIK